MGYFDTLIYDLPLKVWLMGCAICIYLYWLIWKWMAYSSLTFPDTACPTRYFQYLLIMRYLMYGLLFLQLSILLGYFRPWIFFLKGIALVTMELLYIIFTY